MTAHGALSGITVLDFTQVILGPSATTTLADHGADVIKVERPGAGDLSRQFGPYLDGIGLSFAALNRNKRSIAVNLKSDDGLQVVLRLAKQADVVINNFRPGVMDSLGLGYESIKALNPGVVYATGTGFGTTGPMAEARKPGHETVAQALTGVMAAIPDPNGHPRRLPIPIADMTAGNLLVQGILMALVARERTGVGQEVQVSLLDGMMWMQAWPLSGVANRLPSGTPLHGENPLDGGVYATKTGYIVVTGLFKANPLANICDALEIDDLSTDPRFDSEVNLSLNAEALHQLLQARIEQRSAEEWLPILESFDIITAPILTLEQAQHHPQVTHNQMIVEIPMEGASAQRHAGVPVKMGSTPGTVRRGAPSIGQDTVDVLKEMGIEQDEISRLVSVGAIATGGDA